MKYKVQSPSQGGSFCGAVFCPKWLFPSLLLGTIYPGVYMQAQVVSGTDRGSTPDITSNSQMTTIQSLRETIRQMRQQYDQQMDALEHRLELLEAADDSNKGTDQTGTAQVLDKAVSDHRSGRVRLNVDSSISAGSAKKGQRLQRHLTHN